VPALDAAPERRQRLADATWAAAQIRPSKAVDCQIQPSGRCFLFYFLIYSNPAGSKICTLTCVKMIETCVDSTFATICVRSAIASCFFCFGEDG
jgi:hypothetical protein